MHADTHIHKTFKMQCTEEHTLLHSPWEITRTKTKDVDYKETSLEIRVLIIYFQFWRIIRLKIDLLLHTDLSYISDLPKKGNKMKQFVDEFKT